MPHSPRAAPNRELFWPYALPYLLYAGVGGLQGELLGPVPAYSLRLLLCGGALAWAWRRYVPLRGPLGSPASVMVGLLAGVLGTLLWIGLLAPFTVPGSVAPWSPQAWAVRAASALLLAPLAEELLLRGYLLRLIVQWQHARAAGDADALGTALERRSLADLAPGDWTPFAVAATTLLFALGHAPAEWLAATAYGLLMACLWIVRRDLLSCVIAHAVTNATLAGYVLQAGRWELW